MKNSFDLIRNYTYNQTGLVFSNITLINCCQSWSKSYFALNILSRGSYAIMIGPRPHNGDRSLHTRSDRSRGQGKKGYQINTESIINQRKAGGLGQEQEFRLRTFRNYHFVERANHNIVSRFISFENSQIGCWNLWYLKRSRNVDSTQGSKMSRDVGESPCDILN